MMKCLETLVKGLRDIGLAAILAGTLPMGGNYSQTVLAEEPQQSQSLSLRENVKNHYKIVFRSNRWIQKFDLNKLASKEWAELVESKEVHRDTSFGGNIAIMNDDGSCLRRLTDFVQTDFPKVSPDGKKVVYLETYFPSLSVIDIDGKNEKKLTYVKDSDSMSPSWSPDSKKIVFFSNRFISRSQIYCTDSDGKSTQQKLTNYSGSSYEPSWSPDGKKIVFTYFKKKNSFESNSYICIMNPDGTKPVILTNNITESYSPSWSPDEKKIAFVSKEDSNWSIYIMNPDGTGQKRLSVTKDYPGFRDISWSPDSRKIAFVSNESNFDIYTINLDGTEQRDLTKNPGPWKNVGNFEPSWSPDGKKIVFTKINYYKENNHEIYVMNADGTGQRNITNHPAEDEHPVWVPGP